MKKCFKLFSVMVAIASVMMSCSEKMEQDKVAVKAHIIAPSSPGTSYRDIVDSTSTSTSVKIIFGWFKNGQNYEDDTHKNDTITRDRSWRVEMYQESVEIVKEIGLKSVGKVVLIDTKGEDKPFIDDKRKLEADYVHNVSFVNAEGATETESLPICVIYDDIKVTDPQDQNLMVQFPRLSFDLAYTGEEKINLTRAKEKDNGSYEYYRATMPYTLKVNGKGEKLSGTMLEAVAKTPDPDPVIIDKKVTDSGFEPKTYYPNGNIKTGRSWIEVTDYWDNGKTTKEDLKEETLNFWQDAPDYATKYPTNLTINQMDSSMGSETRVGSRNGSTSEISVKRMEKVYSTGLNAGGTDYPKSFTLGREIATWSDGTYTFEMPTAEYTAVKVSGFKSPSMDNLTENGVTYERKLNTIDVSGKIAGGNLKLQAQTELRLKKAEEPETFKETALYTLIQKLDATTAYVLVHIRRTSSKGGTTEYDRSVNLLRGGFGDPEEEFEVDELPNKEDWEEVMAGIYAPVRSYGSGQFTKTRYERTAVFENKKDRNVKRTITFFYETAEIELENNGKIEMPYVFFTGDNLKEVVVEGLTGTTANTKEYVRQRYTLMDEVQEKVENPGKVADFRNEFTPGKATFSTSAILKVAKEQEEERETPSWLGDPVDARYTRVQKSESDYFEDMLAFLYEHGVILVPNGDKSKMVIFAFDQANADKYGVELAAASQWYSAVWKSGRWIPAMIQDNLNRQDTAIDVSESLKSWTYKGHGKVSTVQKSHAIEKRLGYECTPVPDKQKPTKSADGKSITLKYWKNNQRETELTLSFR